MRRSGHPAPPARPGPARAPRRTRRAVPGDVSGSRAMSNKRRTVVDRHVALDRRCVGHLGVVGGAADQLTEGVDVVVGVDQPRGMRCRSHARDRTCRGLTRESGTFGRWRPTTTLTRLTRPTPCTSRSTARCASSRSTGRTHATQSTARPLPPSSAPFDGSRTTTRCSVAVLTGARRHVLRRRRPEGGGDRSRQPGRGRHGARRADGTDADGVQQAGDRRRRRVRRRRRAGVGA